MTDPEPKPNLKLLSWNIRKAVGTDWRRRPDRIIAALADLRPAICVLQEADRRLSPRRAALPPAEIRPATGLRSVGAASNGVSLGHHGIAILVCDAVEVRSVAPVDLPGTEPRGALFADLGTTIGPLRVVGVHLGLRRRDRRAQLLAIRHQMAALSPMPTIIAGDFNEWSRRVGLGRLASSFTIHAPGPTFHSSRPIGFLDRIATSPDLTVAAQGVVRHPLVDRASDHLPIWAEIRKDAPASDGLP